MSGYKEVTKKKIGIVYLFLILFLPLNVYGKEITVQFFDEQQGLLDSQVLEEGEVVELPSYTKEGYIFEGYNTMPDGSGTWLRNNMISESGDYYAILIKRQYTVSYYLEGALYSVQQVDYMDQAPNLIPEEKEGYEFLGWGNLEDVREDRLLYSEYELKPVEDEDHTALDREGKEKLESDTEKEALLEEQVEYHEQVKGDEVEKEELEVSYDLLNVDEGEEEIQEILESSKEEQVVGIKDYNSEVEDDDRKTKKKGKPIFYIVSFLAVSIIFFFLLQKLQKSEPKKDS